MLNNFQKLKINEWLEIYFKNVVGINVKIYSKKNITELRINGSEKKILVKHMPTLYTKNKIFKNYWWEPETENFKKLISKKLPMIGIDKLDKNFFENKNKSLLMNYDLFGLIFWKLNLLDEFSKSKKDKHGRIISKNLHAVTNQYLQFPIIDEWLMILKQIISETWPSITFKKQKFSIDVSQMYRRRR